MHAGNDFEVYPPGGGRQVGIGRGLAPSVDDVGVVPRDAFRGGGIAVGVFEVTGMCGRLKACFPQGIGRGSRATSMGPERPR